jgi:hypothetical protein
MLSKFSASIQFGISEAKAPKLGAMLIKNIMPEIGTELTYIDNDEALTEIEQIEKVLLYLI